ncbi:MAG: TetR/AcrR family transcriptional regulator [Ilumatobacteraceae bacterium]
MPKVIDHDERRRQVSAAAGRIVADEGTDALTIRRVAEALDCSTAVVSYYFRDKDELLLHTYRTSALDARARISAIEERDPGDVRGILHAILPLDRVRADAWKIWLSFFGIALGRPELSAEQQQRILATEVTVERALRVASSRGDLAPGLDLGAEAKALLGLAIGIAAQASFDPRRWTRAAQIRAIDDALLRLQPGGAGPCR